MKRLIGVLVGLALLFGVAISANCVIDVFDHQTVALTGKITLADSHNFRKVSWGYDHGPQQPQGNKELHILINSPGGSAYAMVSLYNRIMELKAAGVKIITTINAHGYSAGSTVWLLGDERYIHRYDTIMFHSSKMYRENKDGKLEEVPQKEYEPGDILVMNRFNQLMYDLLFPYFGEGTWNILETDTFFTAEQALAAGLATKII